MFQVYAKPGGMFQDVRLKPGERTGCGLRAISPGRGINRRISPALGSMIPKTFFLT
jgi:hypothetical protein